MNDHRMFSDNPNYFDEEVAANSVDASDRSFLLFMKRNSVDKPAKQEEQKQVPVRKRLACSKFLRYRSNSTTSSQMKSCVYTTPQYYNDISIKNHIENDSSFAQKESNIKVADVKQRHTPRNGQRTTICNDSLIPETRRHSIGTIDLKECLKKQVISDEVPEMMAPKAPIDLYKEGAHSLSTMDDILFVTARHNEQAFMWANHLKTCFDKITKQRGKIPFNFLHVRIDENQVNQQLVQRSLSTKLQVIIVCPVMLTLSTQYLHSTLVSILKPEQVLGLLLNVTEICAFENHKDTFPGYNKWRTCVAGDHEQSFLSELLGIATDILGCALRQQPHCYDPNVASLYKPSSPTGLHDMFTLFPRKVKIGQNKILAIFAEPLVKNDWIKIKIEKNNEIIEITNIKRRNPYIIQFSIPDSCMEISMMVGVRLEKNNIDLGCRALKCESQFRELEQILRTQNSPMEFLCQATGIAISDRDKLDSHLLQAFQKNVPTNFHLLNYADSEKKSKSHREASPEEYPTLLHFAAYWGLERLCLQLLECPGGDIACEMRNISARTPSDMADLGGHYKLADSIKNFSKMHEFTTMYHYFKGISDFSPNKIIIEPLSNCENSIPSSTPSSATLMVSGQLKQQQPNEGYMEMNASGSDAESISNDALNTVANLNYLIVDTVHSVMRHERT
ncbi:phosphoinositide 3-kinase adapter protein 1 [Sabethes cyaneus]|uniref:phosphoinositide 3-kinase adapter protein 1 n=1 Tax=Sabethes cyaneus TaxID=53552 RepID=UPI00237D94D0|nr:phosphoinositide 3-kinase adapter protein 1 [Sabethes cyaneus]